MDEPHVQHPVGLVQHEDLQLGQVQQALSVQVRQAAWRGDEDLRSGLDGVHLGLLTHAAVDDYALQGQILAIALHLLLVLNGQLPGGGQDERPDGGLALFAGHRVLGEPLQDGHGKGAGFSRSGASAAQHVSAFQGRGDGASLDGSRLGVSLLRQCPSDGFD